MTLDWSAVASGILGGLLPAIFTLTAAALKNKAMSSFRVSSRPYAAAIAGDFQRIASLPALSTGIHFRREMNFIRDLAEARNRLQPPPSHGVHRTVIEANHALAFLIVELAHALETHAMANGGSLAALMDDKARCAMRTANDWTDRLKREFNLA